MYQRNISQSQLASLIGIGKSSISQYLSGKNIPRKDVQQRIAQALDCTVEMLNGEEVPENTDRIVNLSVKEAALRLGKSEQFIRVGLQRGFLPIGSAVKGSVKWTYYISSKKLDEFSGNCSLESYENVLKDNLQDVKITISQAAKLMGKSTRFICLGLQQRILPIGVAVKKGSKKYAYYISPKLFYEFTGIRV